MQRKHKSDFHTHRGTQHITTSSHLLCITPWRGRRSSVLIFLSQLSLSFSVLTWAMLTALYCAVYCSTVHLYCDPASSLSSLWLRLWHTGAASTGLLWPSHSDNNTDDRDSRQLQITSHTERVGAGVNIYISTETHCIKHQPLPADCQISLKSQWSS